MSDRSSILTRRSRTLATLSVALFQTVVAPDRIAFAAPASAGMPIASSSRCRVALTKVSYDDPGADDAEFVEFRVDVEPMTAPVTGPSSLGAGSQSAGSCDFGIDAGADAAAFTDAGAPKPLSLGDCGLGSVELVDGASGGCATYRTIPLADTPVPKDGYVVLCAEDSLLATRHLCDVDHAGHSAIKNGWLQNGPNDGIRFVDTTGDPLGDVGYEGGPSCFSPSSPSLVEESGQAQGEPTPTDDVNAFCSGAFVLLSPQDAPLRDANRCPPVGADASGFDAGSSSISQARDADAGANSAWSPEHAPDTAATSGDIFDPTTVDAGAFSIQKRVSAPPAAPGCTVSTAKEPSLPPPTWTCVSALAFAFGRRARRRLPMPRSR